MWLSCSETEEMGGEGEKRGEGEKKKDGSVRGMSC